MTPNQVLFGVNLGSNSIDPSTAPESLVGLTVTVDVFQYFTWMTGPGEDDYDGGNDFFGTLKGTVTAVKDNGIAVIKPNGFKPNVMNAPFNPDFKAEMKRVGLYESKLTPAGNYEDWYYNLCLGENK